MGALTLALPLLGAISLSVAIQRILAPAKGESPTSLASLAKKEGGAELSAFARINPNGGLLERLEYFVVFRLKVGQQLENLHTMLGRPKNNTPMMMLRKKETYAAVGAGMVGFLSESVFMGLFAGFVGFMIPDLLVKGEIQRRQESILRNFPTFVDLAALTIESGLDYMTAFDRILKVSREKTDLENELTKTMGEVQLGYSRRDALTRFAQRTGIQEIRSFVGLVVQSDELGTSLVDLLRSFGADMRFRRLQRAEKLAAQASTKMLIPLFIFIFPTVFILMLAPMIKSLVQGGLGF